jgi:hypothetical protein
MIQRIEVIGLILKEYFQENLPKVVVFEKFYVGSVN